MNSTIINISKVHSLADIITNSSTEIFTFARKDAKENVIKLVNSLFSIAGSTLTFDDVFTIDYNVSTNNWRYEDMALEAAKYTPTGPGQTYRDTDVYKAALAKAIEDAKSEDAEFYNYENERYTDRFLEVKVKIPVTNPDYNIAAQILSSLHSLFEIESEYNG